MSAITDVVGVIRDAIKQAMDLDLPNLLAMGIAPLSGLLAREL